jgi:hypothetical protein
MHIKTLNPRRHPHIHFSQDEQHSRLIRAGAMTFQISLMAPSAAKELADKDGYGAHKPGLFTSSGASPFTVGKQWFLSFGFGTTLGFWHILCFYNLPPPIHKLCSY